MGLLKHDNFRDYAYVSARKVVRMSKTLKPGAWDRVRNLQLQLGPVGATIDFASDARAEDVIVLVAEVERSIGQQFGIRSLDDPQLRIGHWFRVSGIPMVYGIPRGGPGGVLFLGPTGSGNSAEAVSRRFVLGGSSQYLLDRAGTGTGDAGTSGSLPRSVYAMVQALVGESLRGGDSPGDGESSFDHINVDRLARLLTSGGEPMTALARCLDIVSDTDTPTVIGTPLYIAFQPPP